MAQVWRLKTVRFDNTGNPDAVITLDEQSTPNEINIMVESGTVEVEGDNDEPKDVFGLGVQSSPIIISAGQSFTLNEQQYKDVTVTIKADAIVQLIANL